MKVRLIFRWYDLWIGFYWDRTKRILYFFPVPTVGFEITTENSMPPFLRKITE